MQARIVAGALAAFAMVMAGCVGEFRVSQTEPLRVQLEGAPQSMSVSSSDNTEHKVVVSNPQHVDTVQLDVHVHRTSAGACKVLIKVHDPDTNEEWVVKVIEVGGTSTVTTTTTNTVTTTVGNGTTTPGTTTAPSGGDTIVQNIIVNVHGKDNFVVLAVAQEGSADVNVSAHAAAGSTMTTSTTQPSMTDTMTTTTSATQSTTTNSTY